MTDLQPTVTIRAAVHDGDPTEGGEARQYAQLQVGDIQVTAYESLLHAGTVIVDIDMPDAGEGTPAAVTINDTYVHDTTGQGRDVPEDGLVVLVYGDPVDGLTFVGPVVPNDPDLDRFIETKLRNTTWWYAPLTSLPAAQTNAQEG